MVAALNIVASLILLVMEKHRDIAILKTMGASARSVTTVFMVQGLIIGLVGTALGAPLGCRLRDCRRSLPADPRAVGRLPCFPLPFTVLPADFAARRGRGDPHLLPGDDLSVAAGRAPRSGAGVEI